MDLLNIESQYTNEEKLIQQTARTFANQHLAPVINEVFESGIFPMDLVKAFGALGIFGITLPEPYGSEASMVSYGIICEELERIDSGFRSFLSVQSSLVMYPIYQFGSEKQKNAYLPKLATGEYIGCFGLTEPNHGSNPASMETFARKRGNDWVINGSKTYITNSSIADIFVVWANTEEGVRGFLIEKETKGLSAPEMKGKMSLRASVTGEIILEDVIVSSEQILPGSIEKGILAPFNCLTQARFGISWGAIGAASFCYKRALDYTKSRNQFNKPLSSFQLVQKDLVEMYLEIQKSKAMNYQLARNFKLFPKQQYLYSSIGKKNAARVALDIARSARNLLGGNGIMLEYDVIRHVMNLESVFTYEGTDNIHTLILGKYITGEQAVS